MASEVVGASGQKNIVLSNKELLRLLYSFVTPREKRTLAAAWSAHRDRHTHTLATDAHLCALRLGA